MLSSKTCSVSDAFLHFQFCQFFIEMPQRKIIIRLGTNTLEFNTLALKNQHQPSSLSNKKSSSKSSAFVAAAATAVRYPTSDSSGSDSDKDDEDDDQLFSQRLRRSLEDAFTRRNENIDDNSDVNASENGKQEVIAESTEQPSTIDDDEYDRFEREQHRSYFEEIAENAPAMEFDDAAADAQYDNYDKYDDEYDTDYNDADAELDAFSERLERSFLNGKRNFTYRRSTNENREERYRKNHWIKHVDQRKEEERRSFRIFQANRNKLNSQTEWVIQQSRSGTNGAKYDEDRELQRALQISARDYATQAARHVTALTARQLAELMSRELTPEDYELLLALDETVAKKTVDEKKIATFEQIQFDAATMAATADICMICMTDFQQGEQCTRLPCKHFFHASCIERWLKEFSCCCPIDKQKFD